MLGKALSINTASVLVSLLESFEPLLGVIVAVMIRDLLEFIVASMDSALSWYTIISRFPALCRPLYMYPYTKTFTEM